MPDPILQPDNTEPGWFASHMVLVSIIIVVIIAAAGAIFWIQTSTPAVKQPDVVTHTPKTATDSMVDWKSYTSERDGVTFKYPATYTNVSTTYRSTLSGSDADIYFKNYMNPGTWLPVSTIKIAGYTANKFSGQYCDGAGSGACGKTPWTTYIFLYNGHPFQIEFNGDVSASTETQIFSTFKFTDSVSTADWKTYTNAGIGFVFKYPANLTVKETTEPYDGKSWIQITFTADNSPSSAFSLGINSPGIIECYDENDDGSGKPAKVTMNSIPMDKTTYCSKDYYNFTRNENQYTFSSYGEILPQILSTFKFTK